MGKNHWLIGYDELDAAPKSDKTDAKKPEGNDPPL